MDVLCIRIKKANDIETMTKFVSDALGARAGKSRGFTAKDRRKALEHFSSKGVLPSTSGRDEASLPQIPESKHSRPFVFLDYSVNGKSVGRVVLELFADLVPSPVSLFLSACTTNGEFRYTRVHKILKGLAIFGGKYLEKGMVKIREENMLRHVDGGLVSISRDGNGYAITVSRALHLDATYQVIGKVTKGLDIIEDLCGEQIKADDSPVQMIKIENCGTTDSQGEIEFSGNVDKGSGKALEEVRQDLQCAIHAGLKRNNAESDVLPIRKKIIAFAESESESDSSIE